MRQDISIDTTAPKMGLSQEWYRKLHGDNLNWNVYACSLCLISQKQGLFLSQSTLRKWQRRCCQVRYVTKNTDIKDITDIIALYGYSENGMILHRNLNQIPRFVVRDRYCFTLESEHYSLVLRTGGNMSDFPVQLWNTTERQTNEYRYFIVIT